jgi:3-oxoacyl-[acyl-carrier protein] reductase
MATDLKTVVVTGATRGLGLGIARRLSSEGYRVVATGRAISDELEELIGANTASAGRIEFERLDLAERAELHPFLGRVQRGGDGIYALVNNAAMARQGVLATMHETEIEELLAVNVTNTIILTKYAIRPMLLAGVGRIVNISSIVSSTGFNGLSVYAASKAALIGFTRSLARELGKAGITVNAVAPGYMRTRMSAGLNESQLESIVRRTPAGRLADVDDVAGTVAFLLGPDSAMITGTTLTVDGGSTA